MHCSINNIVLGYDYISINVLIELINPCGIKEFSVATLDDYAKGVDFREVVKKVKEKFSLVFETNFKKEISEGMS